MDNIIFLLCWFSIGAIQILVASWVLRGFSSDKSKLNNFEFVGLFIAFSIGWPVVTMFLLDEGPKMMREKRSRENRKYLLTSNMIDAYLEEDYEKEEELFQILLKEKLIV
jgi:hypothetical protein